MPRCLLVFTEGYFAPIVACVGSLTGGKTEIFVDYRRSDGRNDGPPSITRHREIVRPCRGSVGKKFSYILSV